MRLKYTSFKSLTLKKKRKKKKSIANAFVLGPAYELYYSLIRRFAPRLMSEAVCSVYWVKKWKNKKKRGGEGEKWKKHLFRRLNSLPK